MRIPSVAATLGVLCLVAALGAITPADAGPAQGNYLVVRKVVDGPVPEGTVFEIEGTCTTTNGLPDADPTSNGPVTLKFDANGDPLGAGISADEREVRVGPLGPDTTCKVTETVTGGAAVSYACQIAEPTNGAAPDVELDASCVDEQTVAFGKVSGAEGTVTVTNTFEPKPEPEPEPEPEADAAPDTTTRQPSVVAARPTFTG